MKTIANQSKLLSVVSLCVVMVSVMGCYEKRRVTPPETFPISGRVVSNAPIPAGYQIQFTPSDQEKTASGEVQTDGTFKLTTRYMGVVCDGAAAGSYRVMLIPSLGLANQGVAPYTHPQPVEIQGPTSDLEIPFGGQ